MSNLSAPEIHRDDVQDHPDDRTPDGRTPGDFADRTVEVRRNGGLAAAVGVVAAGVGLAYLARATAGGSWLDWAIAAVMALVAGAYLTALVDSRTPLLIADDQGVRVRLGRSWRGVPWEDVECLEHEPRGGVLRDGMLVLVPRDPDGLLGDLDAAGRRQVALSQRIHHAPLAIVLGLSTRVIGADGDLTAALERLAGEPGRVVEVLPEADAVESVTDVDGALDDAVDGDTTVGDTTVEDATVEVDEDVDDDSDDLGAPEPAPGETRVLHDPRPALARGLDRVAELLRLRTPADRPADQDDQDDQDEQDDEQDDERDEAAEPDDTAPGIPVMRASTTPSPLRKTVLGTRAEVSLEGRATRRSEDDPAESADPVTPTDTEQRGPVLIDDTVFSPAPQGPVVEPAPDPIVGPQLAGARTRLALSVDQLAERTRIRPHVIESIEVDDFAPCGGDFYARGHLRTLARVLGVDAAPLLAAYDERYADAPIDARRVFEAELATGPDGPIRSTRGGPNWSVLVAAVMALVLAWSIARLIMDNPVSIEHKPVLNGSPAQPADLGPAVPVVLDAVDGGAHVVVRDGADSVVFSGDLAYGQKKALKASPPVQVQSSDGALEVTVDGQQRGPVGDEGSPAQDTYAAAE